MIFNFDRRQLNGIKIEIFADLGCLVLDILFGLWGLNYISEEDRKYPHLLTLLLICVAIYFVYIIVKLTRKFKISENLRSEKLEITENGVNLTYHENVLFSESLKYIEIPFDNIRSVEVIDNYSFKGLKSLLYFKEEYKTIQIYASNGLFKLFIENSEQAAFIINFSVNKAKGNS